MRLPARSCTRSPRRRRALERLGERVLVEHDPEMVDPRERPLAGLDDDVDGAALELREPEAEPARVELLPRDARLERDRLVADAAVPGDELEAELRDVAGLDLARLAGDEVVVEELHGAPSVRRRTWTTRTGPGVRHRDMSEEPGYARTGSKRSFFASAGIAVG